MDWTRCHTMSRYHYLKMNLCKSILIHCVYASNYIHRKMKNNEGFLFDCSILMSTPCLIFSLSPHEIFTVYFSSIQLKRIIIGNSTFRVNFNAAAECCVKKFWNSPNGANRNSPNSRESFSKRVCWKIAVAVISETFRKSLRTYYLNW